MVYYINVQFLLNVAPAKMDETPLALADCLVWIRDETSEIQIVILNYSTVRRKRGIPAFTEDL